MFYVVDLDVRQSRQANDSASIVKRAKERFCNSESWIGKPSTNLEKEVKTAVESRYGSVSTRLVGLYVKVHAACGSLHPRGCSTYHSEKFCHI